MTAILSWLIKDKDDNPFFMTVGDTKISQMDGLKTLTLEGAKILELVIKCKDLSTPQQFVYHNSSIGFAFAGSSLVALNTYTLLQSIFSNIGGLSKTNNLPDFPSLADIAKKALEFYFKSIRSNCEIILFGFCPKHNSPHIATISSFLEDGKITTTVNIKNEFAKEVSVVHIGDKRDEILINIEKRLRDEVLFSTNYWRTPAMVLEELINQGKYDTIGGNLQIVTVHFDKFSMFSHLISKNGDARFGEMKFRNIDIFSEIGQEIGDCFNAISGLKLRFNS